MNRIEIKSLKVSQPIGEFYIGVISYDDLIKISKADVRRIESDLDKYLGIQRKLSSSRVEDLKKYVNTLDATFPTSIILAVDNDCAEWNEQTGTLILKESDTKTFDEIAQILDGQHRIEGLKGFEGNNFQINLTIFVDTDIADQANIFATVNLAQTKVNKSLVYDLYDYSRARSPQKTAHDIVISLDRFPESPFHEMIKRLGFATPGRTRETLTQAAIVETLLKYFITDEPIIDRDTLLKGKKLKRATHKELQKHPFRNLFIEEKDVEITKMIINFFDIVREKWPNSWNSRETGIMLPKTNGVRALFRFMRDSYLSISGNYIGKFVSKSDFKHIFDQIELTDNDFTVDNFPPGTSGESKLLSALREQTKNLLNNQKSLF